MNPSGGCRCRNAASHTVSGQAIPASDSSATKPIAPRCSARSQRIRIHDQCSAAPIQISGKPAVMKTTIAQ